MGKKAIVNIFAMQYCSIANEVKFRFYLIWASSSNCGWKYVILQSAVISGRFDRITIFQKMENIKEFDWIGLHNYGSCSE